MSVATITVKCNGYKIDRNNLHNLSAAQAEQILKAINPDMVAIGGEYEWSLHGCTQDGYRIVAKYDGGSFVDSTGKTPTEAIRNCYPAATALINRGWTL